MKKILLSMLALFVFASVLNFNLPKAQAVTYGQVVGCYYLSLRDGSGRWYRKLAELPSGTWVHVYDNFSNGFVRVYYPDLQLQGWCSTKYLSW